jgi:hypothetical protein
VKLHSTNYFNTFIQVAEDCPATAAEVPPNKNLATIARLQYEMIHGHPYLYTSDDIVFGVYAQRQGVARQGCTARQQFFSKGQPCMRSSPLPKRYGWGIHSNHEGKLALVAIEDARYRMLASDTTIRQLMATRSKRP